MCPQKLRGLLLTSLGNLKQHLLHMNVWDYSFCCAERSCFNLVFAWAKVLRYLAQQSAIMTGSWKTTWKLGKNKPKMAREGVWGGYCWWKSLLQSSMVDLGLFCNTKKVCLLMSMHDIIRGCKTSRDLRCVQCFVLAIYGKEMLLICWSSVTWGWSFQCQHFYIHLMCEI